MLRRKLSILSWEYTGYVSLVSFAYSKASYNDFQFYDFLRVMMINVGSHPNILTNNLFFFQDDIMAAGLDLIYRQT